MKLLFKEGKYFSILFLVILFVDLFFTNSDHLYAYRYYTKIWICISLVIHFYYNSSSLLRKERVLVFLALLLSLISDIVLITDAMINLIIGMTLFILVKVCYISVYAFKAKFDIDRLIPFLAVTLLYCLFIMYFLYDGLGNLFTPVVLYVFVSLLMTKMAYLRYRRVNKKSYYFSFFGAMLFMVSETIMAFYNFYTPLPFSYTTIILTYGISQYLTVRGIILQNRVQH